MILLYYDIGEESGGTFSFYNQSIETFYRAIYMKQYIITTVFDGVLHCFCFVYAFCLVSLQGH